MPDYSSTAQALSRPHSRSPSISPNLEQQQERQERQDRPAWSRISSSARRPNNTSPYSSTSKPTSFIDQALRTSAHLQRKILSTFQRLTLLQQCLAVIAAVAAFVGGVLFLIYNEKIFAALGPVAKQWRQLPGGWVIVWLLTFICAFPPLIGYSSAVTISGFVYGFPNGWFIVSTATVVGSLASFVASRTVLSGYVHGLVGKDKRFEALALTLKHDGLKILCMIRFCPLPYSLSNAAMSTFPTVHPLSFALATLIASPKLLIHVFIGSRMAAIAESNEKMDFTTKMVNYASIAVGVTVGTGLGFYIYQRTIARAKELEREELEAAGGEAGLVRGGGYDDELDVDAAALMNDDDISLWDNDDIANAAYRDEFSDGSDQDEQKAKASR